jgi:hypothetical protein
MSESRFNNQILSEAWNNYKSHNNDENGYECRLAGMEICTKEQFLYKCKNDKEFSEIWGLKMEERELDLKERSFLANSNHYEVSQNIKMFTGVDEDHTLTKNLDDNGIPSKLIALTYKDKKIEIYE